MQRGLGSRAAGCSMDTHGAPGTNLRVRAPYPPAPCPVWDPSRTSARGTDREVGPKHAFKAHDSAISSMTYFQCYTQRPDPPPLRLAAAGAPRRLSAPAAGCPFLRLLAASRLGTPPPLSRPPCPARRRQARDHVGRGLLEVVCQGPAPGQGLLPLCGLCALGRRGLGGAAIARVVHRCAARATVTACCLDIPRLPCWAARVAHRCAWTPPLPLAPLWLQASSHWCWGSTPPRASCVSTSRWMGAWILAPRRSPRFITPLCTPPGACVGQGSPSPACSQLVCAAASCSLPARPLAPTHPPARPHPRARPHLMCASTNTGAVLLSFDTNEKPAVVALPAQVVTLKELLQDNAPEGGSKRTSEPGAPGIGCERADVWVVAGSTPQHVQPHWPGATPPCARLPMCHHRRQGRTGPHICARDLRCAVVHLAAHGEPACRGCKRAQRQVGASAAARALRVEATGVQQGPCSGMAAPFLWRAPPSLAAAHCSLPLPP